jgi:hypothetical protein
MKPEPKQCFGPLSFAACGEFQIFLRSLIARGQIPVTPIIVERLIPAMTTFDPVASDQAKFEQTVRDGQQPFSSGRRERSAAYALLQLHRRNPYRPPKKKRTAAERLNEGLRRNRVRALVK